MRSGGELDGVGAHVFAVVDEFGGEGRDGGGVA